MIKLSEIPTIPPEGVHKKTIRRKTDKMARRIADLQHVLYAQGTHAVLIVLQGMDATGKDGIIQRVFRYCSPTGINAYGFKKPTTLEFAHDFLWRVHKVAPAKGMIQIFNRSHYEDVLIQRVHRWISEERVDLRIRAINDFEELLRLDNNTLILKFYLHISTERQKAKLQQRIDDPRRNWKHNPNDWEERKFWGKYMDCYEDVINRSVIPWTIVPVDRRWYRDYVVAKEVLRRMKSLPLVLPKINNNEEE